MQLLRKSTTLVHFVYSILSGWIIGISIKIFKKNHTKIKYLNILSSSELQVRHLVIPQNRGVEINLIQFNLSQQNINVELHII